MSKHTSGPWVVVTEEGKPVVKSFEDFYITNTIDAAGYESDDDTKFVNARLIAAAPDLLEALKECANLMDHHMIGCDAENAVAKASAAIAKATGADA